MPWCDDCSKFWNPNSMPADGRCPTCGRVIAERDDRASGGRGAQGPEGGTEGTDPLDDAPTTAANLDLKALAGESGKAPWHFKLMLVALALYLGWRAWQLLAWLAGKLF